VSAAGRRIACSGNRVSLHYRLAAADGTEISSTFGQAPVLFTLGTGELHASLERVVLGLAPGERRMVFLAAAEAFGLSQPELEQVLPREAFPAEMAPEPGQLLEFTLPSGETLPGVVRRVGKDAVTVDFNHPLSDCDVIFEVELVEILE
jgi:FKBP-type peptidyl-prolyl cis-trans isomerase 2